MKNRNGGTIIICIVVAIALAVPMLVAPAYLASKIVKRNSSEVSLDDVLAENEADNYDLSDTSYEVGDLLQEVDELEELTSIASENKSWDVIHYDMARDMEVREPSIDNDDIYGEIVDEVEVYKTFDIGNVATFSVKKLWLTTDRYGYVVADVELDYNADKVESFTHPWIYAVDGIWVSSGMASNDLIEKEGTVYGKVAAIRDDFPYSVGNKLDQVVFDIQIITRDKNNSILHKQCIVDINEIIESDLDSLELLYRDPETDTLVKKGYVEKSTTIAGDCLRWMAPVYEAQDVSYDIAMYHVTEAEVNGIKIENADGLLGTSTGYWDCGGITIDGDNIMEAYGDGVTDIKVTLRSYDTHGEMTLEQHDGFDVNITEATAEESATEESSSDVEADTKQSNDTASKSSKEDEIEVAESFDMQVPDDDEELEFEVQVLQEEDVYKSFKLSDTITLSVRRVYWVDDEEYPIVIDGDLEYTGSENRAECDVELYSVDNVRFDLPCDDLGLTAYAGESKRASIRATDVWSVADIGGIDKIELVVKSSEVTDDFKEINKVTKKCVIDIDDVELDVNENDLLVDDPERGIKIWKGNAELVWWGEEQGIQWNFLVLDDRTEAYDVVDAEVNGVKVENPWTQGQSAEAGYYILGVQLRGDNITDICEDGLVSIKGTFKFETDGYEVELEQRVG